MIASRSPAENRPPTPDPPVRPPPRSARVPTVGCKQRAYDTNRYAVVARVIDGDTVELSTGERSMVDAVYCINEGTDDAEKRTGRLAAEVWAWVESDEMSITSFQWIRQVLDLEPDSTSTIWTRGRIGRRKLRCCACEDKGQIVDMYDRTIYARRATG